MKTISITVSDENLIPSTIYHFTPEDNLLMLQIGSRFVLEGTKSVSQIILQETIHDKQSKIDLLEREIDYQKRHFKEQLENLVEIKNKEMDSITNIKMENKDIIIEDLKKQLSYITSQLEQKRNEFRDFQSKTEMEISKKYEYKDQLLELKIQKEKEFFEKERERGEKTLEKLQEMIQLSSSKTSVKLGMEGEYVFGELAERAFRDFDSFYFKYTGDQTSKGDYHLFFKDFSVLVDTKKYSGNVGNSSKKKFKYDIENNKHMKIAWLISLNSSIDSYDKYPIMFEMVNEQCIFYINNLMKYEEPVEMLRLIWSVSQNVNLILSNTETGEEDFKLYKKKVSDIVKELEKITREESTIIADLSKNIENLKKNNKVTKDFLKDLINEKINEEINQDYENVLQEQLIDTIRKWCNTKLKCDTDNDSQLKYSDIWDIFSKDIQNKRYNIKKLQFKTLLTEIYKENLDNNSKTINFKGISWL